MWWKLDLSKHIFRRLLWQIRMDKIRFLLRDANPVSRIRRMQSGRWKTSRCRSRIVSRNRWSGRNIWLGRNRTKHFFRLKCDDETKVSRSWFLNGPFPASLYSPFLQTVSRKWWCGWLDSNRIPLWCWKRPLCQLCHNHCPSFGKLILRVFLSEAKGKG